jgi:hypothetical protein
MQNSNASSTRRLIGWILIIFIAVAGCATSNIQEKESAQYNAIVPTQSVVVVPIDNRSDKVADCVENILNTFCPNLKFLPLEKFVDFLFPWFEPSTFPKSKEDLDELLTNRLVQSRLDEFDVRYVITIHGETVQSEYQSVIPEDWAEVLAQGAGFLIIEAERRTDIWASVIDIKKARIALKAESHKEKTRRYAAVMIFLPLYIQPAITETPACYEIGKTITQQLLKCNSTVNKEGEHYR